MTPHTCTVDGCEREHAARGLCMAHYHRKRKYGDPLAAKRQPTAPCSVKGCDRSTQSITGLCDLHFKRQKRHGDPTAMARVRAYNGAVCSVSGCNRVARRQGLCDPHAQRLDKRGDVQAGVPIQVKRHGMSAYDRVMAMSYDDPTGCRLFVGGRTSKGYGRVGGGGGSRVSLYVHRVVWAHHNGPIPDGMVVMHACDVSSCCAIDHLSIGTYAENTADMMSKGHHWSQK